MAIDLAEMKAEYVGRARESRKMTSRKEKGIQVVGEYDEVYDFGECLPGLEPLMRGIPQHLALASAFHPMLRGSAVLTPLFPL